MAFYQLLLFVVCYIGYVTCACCPNGWVSFESSCYLFGRQHASTFTEAENYCRQHHSSHLVEVETTAENLFLKDYVRGLIGEGHWIGLTDEQTEGVWRWYHSDTAPLITDWYPGEPANAHGREDCAVFWPRYDYHWGDIDCMTKNEPICELRGQDSETIVG